MSASCDNAFVAAVARSECTQPNHFSIDAGCPPVLLNNIPVNGARLQMFIQRSCAVVFHGAEEGTVQNGTVRLLAILPPPCFASAKYSSTRRCEIG